MLQFIIDGKSANGKVNIGNDINDQIVNKMPNLSIADATINLIPPTMINTITLFSLDQA